MKTRNILFLCTRNSARSILAEAQLNRDGPPHFRGFSAGSHPSLAPHPMAIALLDEFGLPTQELRSKSWTEYAGPDAPKMDIVITVCDYAAGETCPVWPGAPVSAQWGIDDPAAVKGEGERGAFLRAMGQMQARIALLLALPIDELDSGTLKARLQEIGQLADGDTHAV